jgi:hypothetical protein
MEGHVLLFQGRIELNSTCLIGVERGRESAADDD